MRHIFSDTSSSGTGYSEERIGLEQLVEYGAQTPEQYEQGDLKMSLIFSPELSQEYSRCRSGTNSSTSSTSGEYSRKSYEYSTDESSARSISTKHTEARPKRHVSFELPEIEESEESENGSAEYCEISFEEPENPGWQTIPGCDSQTASLAESSNYSPTPSVCPSNDPDFNYETDLTQNTTNLYLDDSGDGTVLGDNNILSKLCGEPNKEERETPKQIEIGPISLQKYLLSRSDPIFSDSALNSIYDFADREAAPAILAHMTLQAKEELYRTLCEETNGKDYMNEYLGQTSPTSSSIPRNYSEDYQRFRPVHQLFILLACHLYTNFSAMHPDNDVPIFADILAKSYYFDSDHVAMAQYIRCWVENLLVKLELAKKDRA